MRISLFLNLGNDCFIRLLESPCIYSRQADELYELDGEALDFLTSCSRGDITIPVGVPASAMPPAEALAPGRGLFT